MLQMQQGYYSPMFMPMGAGGLQQPMSSPSMGVHGGMGGGVTDSCQIGVPSAAVGAIIGTSGSNIKQLMRDSGAFANVSMLVCK